MSALMNMPFGTFLLKAEMQAGLSMQMSLELQCDLQCLKITPGAVIASAH